MATVTGTLTDPDGTNFPVTTTIAARLDGTDIAGGSTITTLTSDTDSQNIFLQVTFPVETAGSTLTINPTTTGIDFADLNINVIQLADTTP